MKLLSANTQEQRLLEKYFPFLIIFSAWVIVRSYVYYNNWPYFLEDNADYSSFYMWYLPTDIIQHRFFDAMVYLRGEPPLPQFILGLLMKGFGWPFVIPVDSFFLSVLTLLTAWMMRAILIRYRFSSAFSTTLAAAWCVYPANLSVEVYAFPTALYEALPSFIFILSLWLCLRCFSHPKMPSVWLFGVAGILLSMSRSTLSWIFILPIVISFLLPGNKLRIVAGCLAIIFQLLWSVKNYAVYGQFHLETSSDVGQNIFSAILNTGHIDDFLEYSKQKHPNDTFILYGIPCLLAYDEKCLKQQLPDAQHLDDALREKLPSKEPLYGETYYQSALSQKVKPLYADYLLHNPIAAFNIFRQSYLLFWGDIYWRIGYIKGLDTDRIMLGVNAAFEKYKWLNILGIHLIGIPVFLFIIYCVLRKKTNNQQVAFLYAFLGYLYVAAISSLGEYTENTRYRVDVEALVWLLPFMAWRCMRSAFLQHTLAQSPLDK